MKYTDPKPRAVFDTECTHDHWLIYFKDIATGRKKYFEIFEGHPLDRAGVLRVMRSFTLVSFNGNGYDIPMIKLALTQGVTTGRLKQLNDDLIVRRMKSWDAEEKYRLPDIPWLDHIDIIEPAPSVKVSLKLYGGRLHSKRLQDMPFDPDDLIFNGRPPNDPDNQEKRNTQIQYCENDLDTTIDLYKHIEPQINLRCQMSDQYKVDLRSKSDAQIAEAVIRSELERIKGDRIYKPTLPNDYSFHYEPPAFLSFQTEQMQEVFKTVCDATFTFTRKVVRGEEAKDEDVIDDGDVKVKISGVAMPTSIKKLKIKIGNTSYKLGIGGLHSQEKKVSHYRDGDTIIRDADVAAFYPMLILVCMLYPDHLGPEFLDIYRKIRERRIDAKDNIKKLKARLKEMSLAAMEEARLKGDMASFVVIDMTLKIVLNGTFGKLGSKWSFLFAPNLMIQVTITGQLVLLMLIERLTLAGIHVISANTDGIVCKFDEDQEDTYHDIIREWESTTGFEMEFADYESLHAMSVNSYIAIKTDGSVKQKGLFAFVGSKGSPAEKNPTNYVCIDAVINYLTKGTPLEETIEWCPDMRRFLTVRKVDGGARDSYDHEYLGKVVRWYHSKNRPTSQIEYVRNGNKVPKSDGAKPLMELDGTLQPDIDYSYYVNQSRRMLADLGVL